MFWDSSGLSKARLGHKRGILLFIFAQKEQARRCDKTSNDAGLGGAGGQNRTDMEFTFRWILSPEVMVFVWFGLVSNCLLLLSAAPFSILG